MKNNNLTLVMLVSTISVLVVTTSLDSVYGQENAVTHVEILLTCI